MGPVLIGPRTHRIRRHHTFSRALLGQLSKAENGPSLNRLELCRVKKASRVIECTLLGGRIWRRWVKGLSEFDLPRVRPPTLPPTFQTCALQYARGAGRYQLPHHCLRLAVATESTCPGTMLHGRGWPSGTGLSQTTALLC